MSAPAIAPADAAYASVLAAIHVAAFPSDAWSAEAIAGLLHLPGHFALRVEASAMLLARVAADESELLTLAVLPGDRRKGFGGALLDAAMQRVAQRGARCMFLEVAEANGPARALYERRGFRQVGRRDRYYADSGSALVLRAPLSRRACAAGGG